MHCAVDAPSPATRLFRRDQHKRTVRLARAGRSHHRLSVARLRRSHHDWLGGFGRCEALAAIANPTGTSTVSQPTMLTAPNEASDLHARDQLVHAVVVRPKRILSLDGALRLVVELQVDPVDGVATSHTVEANDLQP
jgi:hypothetical protein